MFWEHSRHFFSWPLGLNFNSVVRLYIGIEVRTVPILPQAVNGKNFQKFYQALIFETMLVPACTPTNNTCLHLTPTKIDVQIGDAGSWAEAHS
jgi:hypothetical protein